MKLSIKIIFLSIVFLQLTNLNVLAHHGGEGISGVGIAGPIITVPAYTLPKKSGYFDIRSEYINFDSFSNNELINLDKRGEHIHSTGHLFVPSLGLGYGITDNLTVGLRVPYIFRYQLNNVHDGLVTKNGNSIGIGDITFFGQYRFLKNEKHKFQSAILTGLKIPSGVQRTKTNSGSIFEQDSQPGSGSWDPLVGIAVSKRVGKFSIDANGLYKFTNMGARGSNLGDSVSYNLSASHRLIDSGELSLNKKHLDFFSSKASLDVILELNGNWSQKPITVFGFKDENHAGNVIYISPGFRLTQNNKWIWTLSTGLPIIDNLNGRQRAPGIRLITGLTRAF